MLDLQKKAKEQEMKNKKAFSMLELIIVIAISATLCSILVTSIHKSKDLATQVSCMSNISQIRTYMELYRKDYRELPYSEIWLTDFSPLEPYIGKTNSLKSFTCPGSKDSELTDFGQLKYQTSYYYVPSATQLVKNIEDGIDYQISLSDTQILQAGESGVIYDKSPDHHNGRTNIAYLFKDDETDSKAGSITTLTSNYQLLALNGDATIELPELANLDIIVDEVVEVNEDEVVADEIDDNVADNDSEDHEDEVSDDAIDSEDDVGLIGGHFDVDTDSKAAESIGDASSGGHVHAYDNEFDVTSINCFQFHDGKLSNISTAIPHGKRFKLVIINSQLNSGAEISSTGGYDEGNIYSIDGITNSQKLTELTVSFDEGVIAKGGLIPTEPKVVRSNTPGPGNSYRSGAYVVQAVEVDAEGQLLNSFESNGSGGAAVLWEVALYWHYNAKKEGGSTDCHDHKDDKKSKKGKDKKGKKGDKNQKGNNGHGNNVDGVDSSNPGNSKSGEDSEPNVDDEKGKKGKKGKK